MIRLLLCLLLLANSVEAAQQLVSTTVAPNAATGNDPKTGLPYNPAVIEFADFYQTWLNNQPKINANFTENYGSIGTVTTSLAGKAPASGALIQLGTLGDLQVCTDTTHTSCFPLVSDTPTNNTIQVPTSSGVDTKITTALAGFSGGGGTEVYFVSSAPTANSVAGLYRLTTSGAAYSINADWFIIDGVSASPIYDVVVTEPTGGTISSASLGLSCPGACSRKSLAQTVTDWVFTPNSGYSCASISGFTSGDCSSASLLINADKTSLSAAFSVTGVTEFLETFEGTGFLNAGWTTSGTVNADSTSPVPPAGTQALAIDYNGIATSPATSVVTSVGELEFYLYADTASWAHTNAATIVKFYDSSAAQIGYLSIRIGGYLRLYGGTAYNTSASALTVGTWYHCWIDMTPLGTYALYYTPVTGSETKPGSSSAACTSTSSTTLSSVVLEMINTSADIGGNIVFDNVRIKPI